MQIENSQNRASYLRSQILKARHAYYYPTIAPGQVSATIMTDREYDAMEDELALICPDDPIFSMVGSPVPKDSILTSAQHAIPMGSQDKVNSEDEFRAWCLKNKIEGIHASLKGDGGSVGAYYRKGMLSQAIARGDGLVGEDITANAIQFKGLPAWVGTDDVGFNGSVRFEAILTFDDWAIVDPRLSSNTRSAGNGVMRRKNGEQSQYLTAFAFDIDEMIDGKPVEFGSESVKIARLRELGFNTIPREFCKDVDEAVAYFRNVVKVRENLPFLIDGIVLKIDDIARQQQLGVSDGCPKGQTSWKFDSAGAESVLEALIVSGGHTGGLYPNAQLRPVRVGGTTITSASLANYDEIERLGLAVGDSVWVIRANDVIPKIVRVTHRPETRQIIERPTCCPFCGGEVGQKQNSKNEDGVIIVCKNPECAQKSTGKIGRWLSSLSILGIGDVTLESMIERFDLGDVADLYTLHERKDDLAELVTNEQKGLSLGEKRTASILAAIDAARNLTLCQFLGSLGIEHLGKRRVELITNAADGSLDTLEAWRSGLLKDAEFAEKVGVPNIGTQIQSSIEAMGAVIDKLLAAGVTVQPHARKPAAQSSDANDLKTVCISGTLPSGKKKAYYAEPLHAAGYTLVDDVKKGLSYLVLANPDVSSSKLEKAKKLGVTVIGEDQLIAMIH